MKNGIIFCLFLPLFSNAQIITTFAGNGTTGFSGDGGLATAASISVPGGIALGKSMGYEQGADVYFTGFDNNTIRKVSASGMITTIAGNGLAPAGYSGDNGPATAAILNGPTKITLDKAGNIYFADKWNNVIRKISTAGIITTVAGNGTAGYTGDGMAATASELNEPTGVSVDTFNNIFIADLNNNRIRKVSPLGIITTIAGTGVAGSSGDGGPATDAQLNNCHGVFVDVSGNVYIADQENQKIRLVNAAGIISTFAGTGSPVFGGDGGQATAASFYIPGGVCVDKFGRVFVADQFNERIRVIDNSGIVTTICGDGVLGYSGDGGPATDAMLNKLNDVVVDNSTGRIFLSDNLNNRVRVFYYGPPSTTAASKLVETDIKLYPNPAFNLLTIELPAHSGTEATVELYNQLGQLVEKKAITGVSSEINLSHFPTGMYFAKVDLDGVTVRKKIEKD